MDFSRRGSLALIIRGSEGVGASFARKLAVSDLDLVFMAQKRSTLVNRGELITAIATPKREEIAHVKA